MKISGKTKVVALFGFPIEHTLSPFFHNAAFESLGLDLVYLPFSVPPQSLPQAVKSLKALQILGANITTPHKEKVIPWLDILSPRAKILGAVNTIYREKERFVGENTDGVGFLNFLEKELGVIKEKRVLLFGAGGAARAILLEMVKRGMEKVKVVNRRPERAKKFLERISSLYPHQIKVFPLSSLPREEIEKAELIINATSCGMNPEDPLLFDPSPLHSGQIVVDIIYRLRPTLLLKEARKRGAKTLDGVGMLVFQGAESFRFWTKLEPPLKIMWEVVEKELKGREKKWNP